MDERYQLEQAIAAQESLRGILDDTIIDATISLIKEKLVALDHVPQQQRKLATILFTDIVGSTRLTQGMDPEEQMALIDPLVKRLAARVSEHGGHVCRYQGDGFKAVFGLPVAHENDPAQAIRAGLAIQAESIRIAEELEMQRGLSGFQVRVGLTTGMVFSGGETEGKDTIKGEPVNLAARLESAAQPGTVLISYESYKHVRGIFDVEPLKPIKVKGFPEPVTVYQVQRARERSFYRGMRGVEGVETRMVGREPEFLTLQKTLRDVIEDQVEQMVTVMGDAGLGKSRLLYEFENWVDLQPEQIWFFKGRARLETQGSPYGLLRDLFVFRLGIQDDDSAQTVRYKLESSFGEVFGRGEEGEKKTHITGHLLGYSFQDSPHLKELIENPQQLRDQAVMYLASYFKLRADRNPVLVLLEDLHWADEASLDVLNSLAFKLKDQPVFLLATARHGLLERRQHWGEGQDFHRHIQLEPLSTRESRNLVVEILQRVRDVPEMLRELVVSNAEGNPFYVEELIKMLVEDGIIVPGEPYWRVETRCLEEVHVPPTLTGVLQARLDGLPIEERKTLQGASVIGRVFWDQVLEYINDSLEDKITDRQVMEVLDELRSRELIFRRETSAFAGASELIFKHALLREVTYESVLKRVRQTYHTLVAEWLIEHTGDRESEFTGLIADHLELAGSDLRAGQYLLQAAKQAASIYANDEAIAHYSQAIALISKVSPGDITLANLYRERGFIYEILGKFDLALNDLETALDYVAKDDDCLVKWRILIDLGKLWASRDYNITKDYFDTALNLARSLDQPEFVAESLNWTGNWYTNADEPQTAFRHHQEALSIIEKLNSPLELANTLDLLGVSHLMGGDFKDCVQYYDKAIHLFREMDNRSRLVSSLTGRAATYSMSVFLASISTTSSSKAISDVNEAIRIAGEISSFSGEAWAYWVLGSIHMVHGQFGKAMISFQRGLKISTEREHKEFLLAFRFSLGLLHTEIFAPDQALEHLEKSFAMAKDLDARTHIHLSCGVLAGAHLVQGNIKSAQACLDEVMSSQTPMNTLGKRYCWVRQAELALAQGKPKHALDIIERLISTAPGIEPGDVITYLWMLRGEAFSRLGLFDEAITYLQTAVANAQKKEEHFLLWRAHSNLGQLYKTTGRPDDAESELLAAEDRINELAAAIPDKAARKRFLQKAMKF